MMLGDTGVYIGAHLPGLPPPVPQPIMSNGNRTTLAQTDLSHVGRRPSQGKLHAYQTRSPDSGVA